MTTDRQAQNFRTALRRALDAVGWTNADLGRAIGVTDSAVGLWLSSKDPKIRPDNVFAIERVLELSPGSLSRLLGYLPADGSRGFTDWEEAILAEIPDDDPRTEALARSVLEMVRVAARQSRQIRRGGR